MAKLNLDLKKFKHVKSDDKSTTLQHPDGHIITVAHKPLSKQFQQQLAALSKISSNAETPEDKEEMSSKMANGGNVQRVPMYEGDTPQNALERLTYKVGAPIKKLQAKIEEADKPKPVDEPRALPVKEVIVPQPQPAPMYNSPENQATLANQAEYERAFKAKDAANAAAELQYQQRQNAMVDEPIDQNSYKTYRKAVPEQIPVQRPMPLPNSAPQNEQQFDAAATKAAGIMPVQPRLMPQQVSPQIQEEPQPVYNDTPAVTSSEYAKGGDVEPKHYDEGTVDAPVSQPDQTTDPDQVVTPADQNYLNGLPNQHAAPTPSVADIQQAEKQKKYQKIYQDAEKNYKDFATTTSPNPIINFGLPAIMGGSDKNKLDLNAAKYAQQTLSVAQEDEQLQSDAQKQQNDELAKVNAQRQALNLPPLPGTPQTSLVTSSGSVQTNVPGPNANNEQNGQNNQNQTKTENKVDPNDPMELYSSALALGENAAKLNSKATSAEAVRNAKILQDQELAQNTANNFYSAHMDAIEKENQGIIDDIKNAHIDPEEYWKGHLDQNGNQVGGHSKIMAGIGMILAGFNPTNSPNAAVNFLQYQMNQNLEAQKANIANKQSLLGHQLQKYGNMRDALTAQTLANNSVAQAQLLKSAADSGSDKAKAAADQAIAQLKMQAAPIMQQFALRRALVDLGNNGGSDQAVQKIIGYARASGNHELAKDMESIYVPSVGVAKVPVPDRVRDELTNRQTLNQQAQDLMAYSKTHSNLVPGTSEYNYGVAKAKAFQQTIREGLLNTVYRESEAPLLQSMAGEKNPAGLLKMLNTQPRIRAVIDSNALGLNVLKRNYGLPVAAPAPQIMTKHGVQYQRVENGWKRIK